MAETSIQWTDRVWNPVRGCTRVSEGCRNCYAERMAARNLPEMRSPSTGQPFATGSKAGPRWTGRVELILSKLGEPLHWRKPQRVFVNSMSDLFHESLSDLAINHVFTTMHGAPQHTFQILTKRPERALRWFQWARVANATVRPWPLRNVWLGVSVEDQATADERIPLLLQTPAAVRWVSYEPALARVDFQGFIPRNGAPFYPIECRHGFDACPQCDGDPQPAIEWIVVGGESGPGARPFDVAWARSTVEQCRAAGVPVFVKQLGAWPVDKEWTEGGAFFQEGPRLKDRKGGDMSEWPEALRVREFPEARP